MRTLTVLLALALAAGCGDDDAHPAGTERGPCYPNHTCNDGLVCLSDVCVNAGVDAASPPADSASGAPDARLGAPDAPAAVDAPAPADAPPASADGAPPGRVAFHIACDSVAGSCGHTGRPRGVVKILGSGAVASSPQGSVGVLAAGAPIDLTSDWLAPATYSITAYLDVNDNGAIDSGDLVPPGGEQQAVVQSGQDLYSPFVLTVVKP